MTSEETRAALTRFYDAFSKRDGETMAAMYAPEATFEDAVFALRGADIGKMWIGLSNRSKDLTVAYTIAQAAENRGTVEWTARYTFGGKHPVVNVIVAEIRFQDGLIVEHRDTFDFARWAAQALGLPGALFGRFAWFRRAVSKKAAAGLGLPPKP